MLPVEASWRAMRFPLPSKLGWKVPFQPSRRSSMARRPPMSPAPPIVPDKSGPQVNLRFKVKVKVEGEGEEAEYSQRRVQPW